MRTLKNLLSEIHSLANPERANVSMRFFKTGEWDYGEGDIFLGITMPQIREIVKKYAKSITFSNIDELLGDAHHEVRMAGVLMLVHMARDTEHLPEVVEHYLTARPGVNNWDLVDVSAPDIIGKYMDSYLSTAEQMEFIEDFIESNNLWINRIIIVASFYQIKKWDAKLTLKIAERILEEYWKNREVCKNEYNKKWGSESKGVYRWVNDWDEEVKWRSDTKLFRISLQHDLIHKATGWMLREVGKRCSMEELRGFLDKHSQNMPRTMLRYAIEKMDTEERRKYMIL